MKLKEEIQLEELKQKHREAQVRWKEEFAKADHERQMERLKLIYHTEVQRNKARGNSN